jgi:transcriptional regulator with XRE-family HTH domain
MPKLPRLTSRTVGAVRRLIGDRLRTERKRLGLTQVQLGEALDVTNVSVVSYESGNSSPTADQLNVLHQLGGDVRFVVTGERTPDSKEARKQFALALEMVRGYARLASLQVTERQLVDAAWYVVDAVSRHTDDAKPVTDVGDLVRSALASLSETVRT